MVIQWTLFIFIHRVIRILMILAIICHRFFQ